MLQAVGLRSLNCFADLTQGFHMRVAPTPPTNARLAGVSPAAAQSSDVCPADLNQPPTFERLHGRGATSASDPVAICPSDDQLGLYVAQLRDGPAVSVGEIANDQGHWEVQLKGAGLKPFLPDGGGRGVVRSTKREYLCCETVHGLGIPATRALCPLDSDEEVCHERIERGALLARLAPSQAPFGTFELFFGWQQYQRLGAESVGDNQRHVALRAVNPRLVLRNDIAERAIYEAENGDYREIERLQPLLSRPFDAQPEMAASAKEPPEWGRDRVISGAS